MTKEECLAYINSNPDISPYIIKIDTPTVDLNYQPYVIGTECRNGQWLLYQTDWRGEASITASPLSEEEAYDHLYVAIDKMYEEKRKATNLGFTWPSSKRDIINNFRGDYMFLSNFYESPVTFHGRTYGSSEAAFQAQKCKNDADKFAFTHMSPLQAKKAGRSVEMREDWEDIKYDMMYAIVFLKFYSNKTIRRWLLATGDAYLEEGNTWGDRTWGRVDGSGKNWLGIILMDVRTALRKEEETL